MHIHKNAKNLYDPEAGGSESVQIMSDASPQGVSDDETACHNTIYCRGVWDS